MEEDGSATTPLIVGATDQSTLFGILYRIRDLQRTLHSARCRQRSCAIRKTGAFCQNTIFQRSVAGSTAATKLVNKQILREKFSNEI